MKAAAAAGDGGRKSRGGGGHRGGGVGGGSMRRGGGGDSGGGWRRGGGGDDMGLGLCGRGWGRGHERSSSSGQARYQNNTTPAAFAAASQWPIANSAGSTTLGSTSTKFPGFTCYQIQQLLALITTSSEGASMSGKHNTIWLIDSGASHHTTGNLSLLSHACDIPPSPLGLPDGANASAIKQGSYLLQPGLILTNVLYVSSLSAI
ncbi:PREDICTED: loricrin-like [Erythranthe guttata]|uniref:loricrin-like n=1 Tax=Erythranthe guttata TaxID=4155 RepID=UPI00064D9384|nr:PREDICTED: loricrin-like [Erythranthe guttata]|eukprot:XP_012849445.1 PREDICTED: loricrin-like [Erythranthe guttata]